MIDLQGLPHGKDGLELRLSNSYFVTLDNLSYSSRNISGLIARIVSGGSSTKRALYENTKEISADIKGVLAINSVSMIFKEQDVPDHMFILSLSRFMPSENKAESEMEKSKTNSIACSPKLITAEQVQQEYLNINLHRLRTFLNAYCHYRKIGRQYYYVREEVEKRLLETDEHVEYQLVQNCRKPEMTGRRKR